MAVHIVTDSSHYLDPAEVRELQLQVLPLTLHVGGRDYRERVDITTEALFETLKDRSAGWPTTAAVSPGVLQTAFDALTENGDEVVGIFLSEGTSATVENARTVAAQHQAHERIHVVDSLGVSGALGLSLQACGRAALEGVTATKVAAIAGQMGKAMCVMFTVDTLDYLHRGGRMKGSQALFGSLLDIKPVLWLNEGRIELWSKARGKKKALAAMVEQSVQAMPPGEPVHVLLFDAAAPDDARWLADELSKRLTVEQLYRSQIGPVVAAHVGPGCIAMAVCPAGATRAG